MGAANLGFKKADFNIWNILILGMQMNINRVGLFLGFSLIAASSQAEPTIITAYGFSYTTSLSTINLCRKSHELGGGAPHQSEASAVSSYKQFLECKTIQIKKIKDNDANMRPYLKSNDAKKDMKEFQVALMTAIESGGPKDNEMQISYRQRIASLDEQVESAWQRLILNFN